jgi:8-amino-7-oxononanoate synthase
MKSNGDSEGEVNRNPEAWMAIALQQRRAEGLEREVRVYEQIGGVYAVAGRRWLNVASNDYLDFARRPELVAAAKTAIDEYGTGSTASRLITGTLPLHVRLEQKLAKHKGYPAALVFGSGYMTNAGVISALVGRGDLVFADRLVHASILDAIKMSGARLFRFAHNEVGALEALLAKHTAARRLVVTESVFSMDGDAAPLPEIADLVEAHRALLMIDEAHAGGVFGPHGAGCVAAAKLQNRVHLCMGTFSKAMGGYGGYVCCSDSMREYLVQHARSFIYTTALPPSVMATAIAALDVLEAEPGLGEELLNRAATLRDRLRSDGFDVMQSTSQIVPVLVGGNDQVMQWGQRLRNDGILVGTLRPPTVPPGKARLRLSLTLAHGPTELDQLVDALQRTCPPRSQP